MNVLIAILNQGWVHATVAERITYMLREHCGHDLGLLWMNDKPLDHARNRVARLFIEAERRYDYLLMLDEDNPPVRNPLELVEHDLDIVIFPTPMWIATEHARRMGKIPLAWNIVDDDASGAWRSHFPRGEDIEEVDAGGTGCILIHRRVLEDERMRPPFTREYDEWGIAQKGSDLLFCRRAKALGYRVYAAMRYPCSHWKSRDLLDVFQVIFWRDIQHVNSENKNTPEYWDSEWRKRKPREYPFYAEIARLVSGERVLDFGCGRGDLLARLGPLAHGIDISEEAVRICRERGLSAEVGSEPAGYWDAIVATEVLEHVDDDRGLLRRLFEHTRRVIYTVPHDCLPPGLEPEHRRVYTIPYVREITPHLKEVREVGDYLLVIAERSD